MLRFSPVGTFLAACVFLLGASALPAETIADAFTARMREATLTGTWVPLQGGGLGAEKPDAYQVVRARQVDGDQWELVWRLSHQGRDVEYPFPCQITFAGDVAVLILDKVQVGDGRFYSARVMFHEDVYTGRWWSPAGEGGLVSGVISRAGDS